MKKRYKKKEIKRKNETKVKYHNLLSGLIVQKSIVDLFVHRKFNSEYTEGGRRGGFWEAFDEKILDKKINIDMERFKEKYTYKNITYKN